MAKTGSVEEMEFDYTGRSPRAAPIRIDDGARIARYAEGFPETFAGRWLERDSVGSRVVAFMIRLSNILRLSTAWCTHPTKSELFSFDSAGSTCSP
jgi:hypothetical protein